MQQKAKRPRSKAIPKTEPTTIPAICPPDNPALWEGTGLLEGPELALAVGKSGGIDEVVGSLTPGHRDVTLEAEQQESVAFGELAAQWAQSPGRLVE